ncbi:hypothetical protein INT47_005481 [Mucor saturninus]|uniref:Uncharacterized protein n=1 Tax=Mucor saturninus TaxID=64648 RepID=A0A8H7RD48_9FUNG|nr:hypothetical protein INT47_005481 [Mucor saturninus]
MCSAQYTVETINHPANYSLIPAIYSVVPAIYSQTLFTRQRLVYGCCECSRFENDKKQLYDGLFKMEKVLKDMMYSLYRAAPSLIRQLTLVGYLMYETKFTMVLCDSPAGYVTRITTLSSIDLPEEVDDISNQLLAILKAVYHGRLVMEESNKLVRKEIATYKK